VTDKKNDDAPGFRSATPDRKGRYSDAVLESLESQNDEQAGEMSKKVKMLKEVRYFGRICGWWGEAKTVAAHDGDWRRNPRQYETC
ncbi:UNVERIFIED_CONTAM: hypothetical protein NY603_32620, partial [Bacteroidetes bacterium 56_B9]